MAHPTNLVVQVLLNLPMVAKLENLLQALYSYFSNSLEHHLEFIKLVEILEIRGLNVATLTWPSVGVKPNTWKSWGFGVLRNSRMLRARQQREKHLALGCYWCRWKGLET